MPISIHSYIVHDEEHIYQTLSRKLVMDNIFYLIILFFVFNHFIRMDMSIWIPFFFRETFAEVSPSSF